MNTIELPTLYNPVSAFVLYMNENANDFQKAYVEHYSMDKNGNPVNAHPLTVREAQRFGTLLQGSTDSTRYKFLAPKGLMPAHVLHISTENEGLVIWHTKSAKRKMYFKKSLNIPNAEASVPALLWVATKTELQLFALSNSKRPTLDTPLFHAPFFNMYEDAFVCMGTVDIQFNHSTSLEMFMEQWEDYFFKSYFSHLIQEHNPVKGNCYTLWKELTTTGGSFPTKILLPHTKKLENLLL